MNKEWSEGTAIIRINISMRYMDPANYYQAVPYHATKDRMIYIKKGAAGHKSISTKNIEVLKVFPSTEVDNINNYLEICKSAH
jgi:hypothetical protein